MSPYRSASTVSEALEIGSRRSFYIQVVVGVILFLSSLLLVAHSMLGGGRVSGAIFLPAVFGAVVVARARYARLEASKAERTVRIVVARVGPTVRASVAFDELEFLRVVPTHADRRNTAYELQVGRTRGGPIKLLRADTEASLETERARLGQFLIEAGAMNGPRAGTEAPSGTETLPELDELDDGTNDAETSASRR